MKLRVDRDVLAEAVTWAARSLPQRPPMPVLSGLMLEADVQGTVTLASFDYEVSAKVELAAEVSEAGKVLVSGRLLADISKSLPSAPVELETNGSKVEVTCGSSHFTLMTMPVDEYPALPELPAASGIVDSAVFAEAVSQVTMATSRDDTLPILTGVRVEIEGEKMTLLATDRYRLAVRELTWRPSRPDLSAVALVRGRTLSDVAKTLGGDVTVALSENGGRELIGFSSAGRQSTSLLVDGDYPKVRSLFPESVPIFAVVATAQLLEAVRRVALVAERNTPIRFKFSQGNLTLEAGAGDDAQASEAVESTLHGEDISVGFNPSFIIEGLGALGADFVRFSFTTPMKPVVISGQKAAEGEDDIGYRYLIMPIRI
ncbi:DNA polymerase III subunit beta [Saxibacter everestensis]|uniref:Beta sliding clamp n=1 Tax=Saxibacter everestensis TaxID=2909229 RepID=A0ABY8QSG8_9MICO|nr:DNA polymerase III subunit beta [Brevibacteriaceae bacterium ZFBP1038]